MKAILCKKYGPPESLVLEEVEDPRPRLGQVVIDIDACAINFPDVLMIEGKYQFKPKMPFSPGAEVAGTVSAIGDGVSGIAVGDKVIASPGFGGLAEKVAVAAEACIAVPEGIDLVRASALLYAYGTSQHALVDRAQIQPGESLVVLGAGGGVGLAAVELGALLGARVIAAASTDAKLDLCRQYGATGTVNYSTEDLKFRIRELTSGRGADVIYDAVGGDYSEPALRATGWYGRYLVIGFSAGEIPRIPLNLVLLKGCDIRGVFWGSFVAREPDHHRANVEQLMAWWQEGKLSPYVSETFPLERAGEAIKHLAERRALGKVVVTNLTAG